MVSNAKIKSALVMKEMPVRAVGYGATELTWWLSDKMFGKGRNVAVGTSGNTVDVAVSW